MIYMHSQGCLHWGQDDKLQGKSCFLMWIMALFGVRAKI